MSFLSDLAESMDDSRTVAEIWEIDEQVAGYVWATFTDLIGYDLTFAEIRDIAVSESYRRRGMATEMLSHVERLARDRGASVLRSEAGIENVASHKLHEKLGFETHRIGYEKLLVDDIGRRRGDRKDG